MAAAAEISDRDLGYKHPDTGDALMANPHGAKRRDTADDDRNPKS
jgi:hypothetical protein